MGDEALKKLTEIQEDMKEIKEFISARDKIKNKDYCIQRDPKISYATLLGWFAKGCPRIDSRHVSIKEVDKWVAEKNTKKTKV
jgi:hypothetical protein